MEEFLRSYGLWILLAAVVVGMHWFGGGCGASHRSRPDPKARETDDRIPAQAGRRSGGCH